MWSLSPQSISLHLCILFLHVGRKTCSVRQHSTDSCGILFIVARNESESTVFKGSISSTTYRPTNFFWPFVTSTECTTTLNILIFSRHELKIRTVCAALSSLHCCLCCWVVLQVSCPRAGNLSRTWHHSPTRKKKAKIYIFTKENEKNNSYAQWCEWVTLIWLLVWKY